MQDEVWKEAIRKYFEDFSKFFLADLDEYIDHTKGYAFLDSELQKIYPEGEETKRRTDKLVKVYLKNGLEQWIYLHIEVQGYKDELFQDRMFIYFYRIYDLFKQKIVAFTIFTDPERNYKPSEFNYDFFGTSLNYKYRTYKVLDVKDAELENSDNPFSLVVLAVKYVIRSGQNEDKKLKFKIKLARLLFKKGYNKEKVIEIFNFINAIIKIQDEAKQKIFYEEIKKLEGAEHMTIMSDIGEYITKENREKWMEKGMEKGKELGKEMGKELGKLEVAKKMMEDGLPVEAVVKYTGLMVENIKDLMKT